MCPGTNFGKFLCVGVQRALDAGAEAVHLEEPEFWVRGGYSEGFKREWQSYYGEDWQPPHSSVDAQWRASKLKYFLYRRALQQVFDYIQAYNQRTRPEGALLRAHAQPHELRPLAHRQPGIQPRATQRLRRLHRAGLDRHVAHTEHIPGQTSASAPLKTAFLEYGAMQNLVRSTGRTVWYLNDPIEDNPNHDWEDYRVNWESTLVASLFQPEVWQYEVAPVARAGFWRDVSAQGQTRRTRTHPARLRHRAADRDECAQRHEAGARGMGLRHDRASACW